MLSYETYLRELKPDCKKVEYSLGSNSFVTVLEETEDQIKVTISSNSNHLIFHWGLGIKRAKEWINPLTHPGIQFPSSTVKFDEKAAESPFIEITPLFSTISVLFPKSTSPLQLNFVLRRENAWFNNDSSDYSILLKRPELPESLKNSDIQIQNLLTEIIEVEMSGGGWTLMHRFNMCNGFLHKFNTSQEALAWLFVWMRYSALRKLDWQREYNTKPKDLASSQKNLTLTIVQILKSSSINGLVNTASIVKGILSCMGKGGDNGQRIRDEILQLMHRAGVRYHQVEKDPSLPRDNLYEQWHQKLHNNTTPDDIGICEALIAFNETNDLNKYWEVLNKHGLSRERLAGYERPLTFIPFYAPKIVADLYSYLELLKQVHGAVDLNQGILSCKDILTKEVNEMLGEIAENSKHWDKILQMERVAGARKEIKGIMEKLGDLQYREVVYLDIALESYMRQLCEEIIHLDLGLVYLCKELFLLLNTISLWCSDNEFLVCIEDYTKFLSLYSKNLESYENSLIIKSSADRIQRVLLAYIDQYTELIDSKGRFLGEQFHVDKETLDLFTEELIRGSLFFTVSMVLKKLTHKIRLLSGLKSWQIISPIFPVYGQLTLIDSLRSVAYVKYPNPVILVCSKVTGEEEIPEGATGVISASELDTLAHVSVRARNNKVLLAICYDQEEFRKIQGFQGEKVKIVICREGVEVVKTCEEGEKAQEVQRKNILEPLELVSIGLKMEEFQERRTGAKANNCGIMRKKLPESIGVPRSGALPYGTFEYVLDQNANLEVKTQILNYLQDLSHSPSVSQTLDLIKKSILSLSLSQPDIRTIQDLLHTIGCTSSWDLAWIAIKSVWASKYNERVFLSTKKAHINLDDVKMSVLCQEVISGDYAFVLHTKNPTNNNSEEIYGEIVKGLGETLVGAYEGRALSFVLEKSSSAYKIESFPSKSVYLQGGGFIFRSDSNSEDLPGFAGAGLFDSFIMDPVDTCIAKYAEDHIVTDINYRISMFNELKNLALSVERAFDGVPQDIEGVIVGNKIYVVQSRPQV